MTKRITSGVLKLLSFAAVVVLVVGAFSVAKDRGWLSPIGIESESTDSQVIQAIERTQDVSLLSLAVQGIKDDERCSTVFGACIPGSGDKMFLQYKFTAKLGVNGAQVKVTKSSEHAYNIEVPEFISIGFSDPEFKVAVTDGGVLSWITEDVDETEMINEILNDKARATYISTNQDLLKDQTKIFYDGIITSIDPDATTTYAFS